MKITIDYEVTGCSDCPHLKKGKTFGNDGRDGVLVYKCDKGVFGGKCSYGCDTGLYKKPKVPPYGCPYFKTTPMERVASKLNISEDELDGILVQEHCVLKELQ